jgi:two-component system, NtrC family, sensor kinase
MRVRTFGILLLLAIGVIPIVVAGYFMIVRAKRTALQEVRTGNQRLAERAAIELHQFVNAKLAVLETIGAPIARSAELSPAQARRILKNYRILFPDVRALDIVGLGQGCREVVSSRLEEGLRDRCSEAGVHSALMGRRYLGPIALSADFAPTMSVVVPLELAGTQIGAAVAEIDMVVIWETMKQIRVGQTGFARLVSTDGTLIGHGDPEERRRVFLREEDPFVGQILAAEYGKGARYRNSQGVEVIALSAQVPDVGWTVVVEQPVAEAFAASTSMQRDLLWTILGAVVFAGVLGIVLGGEPIKALYAMRQHARTVASGNLDTQITHKPFLKEMQQLTVDLNDMAKELKRLNEEMQAKERLNTFARVAAGLAHDLQTPIESVRTACDAMLTKPEEKNSQEMLEAAARSHLPRLHRYVRDLRRLAHDGTVPLEVVSVAPRLLAQKVVQDASLSPKWRGIEFVSDGDADGLWADESLLRRAIGNLVANAADACVMRKPPSGRVTVRVSNADNQDALVVDVMDTGVGIPRDKLAEILINDFRSTKRNSGVGLGLGVARHVATSHGGTVTATSEEGKGSTFRITIPRQAITGIAADTALRKGG